MLVEANGESLAVACTVYNQWSHCVELPVNSSYQARKTKRGLEIRCPDQHDKMHWELYQFVSESESNH